MRISPRRSRKSSRASAVDHLRHGSDRFGSQPGRASQAPVCRRIAGSIGAGRHRSMARSGRGRPLAESSRIRARCDDVRRKPCGRHSSIGSADRRGACARIKARETLSGQRGGHSRSHRYGYGVSAAGERADLGLPALSCSRAEAGSSLAFGYRRSGLAVTVMPIRRIQGQAHLPALGQREPLADGWWKQHYNVRGFRQPSKHLLSFLRSVGLYRPARSVYRKLRQFRA